MSAIAANDFTDEMNAELFTTSWDLTPLSTPATVTPVSATACSSFCGNGGSPTSSIEFPRTPGIAAALPRNGVALLLSRVQATAVALVLRTLGQDEVGCSGWRAAGFRFAAARQECDLEVMRLAEKRGRG